MAERKQPKLADPFDLKSLETQVQANLAKERALERDKIA